MSLSIIRYSLILCFGVSALLHGYVPDQSFLSLVASSESSLECVPGMVERQAGQKKQPEVPAEPQGKKPNLWATMRTFFKHRPSRHK